jgi:chorismate mutase
LGPQAAAFAEAAPETVPTLPPADSPDREEIKAMSLDLAALRQSMDEHLAALRRIDDHTTQFVASQQEMASDIAKLKAAEQDILANISSAPLTRPPAAPARKPAPAPPQSRQQPPGR